MKAEFRGKISDGILVELGGVLVAPGVLVVHISVEVTEDIAHAVSETGFLEMDAEFIFGDFTEDGDGIVPEVLPAARGEPLEQVLGFLVPAPPEVAR
jgi:hypothetical protein